MKEIRFIEKQITECITEMRRMGHRKYIHYGDENIVKTGKIKVAFESYETLMNFTKRLDEKGFGCRKRSYSSRSLSI